MIPLHWRASLAASRRHPLMTAMSVASLALGVMVFVGVDVASRAALREFSASVASLTGRATHQLLAGPDGLPEAAYAALRRELGLRGAAPVVELSVRHAAGTLQVLGVDPLAEAAFRDFLSPSGLPPDAWIRLLLERGAVLLGARTAARLQLEAGSRVEVTVSGRPFELQVAGVIADDRLPGIDDLIVADIATAMELRGRGARLTRIDLILPEGNEELRSSILSRMPPDAQIVPAAARARAVLELTRAFELNLAAMGLLAVFIGAFLIYNAMHFSLLRRRELLGTLRSLGVTRSQIFAGILAEATGLGLLAALLGIAAGAWIADALLELVRAPINDLYFPLSAQRSGLTLSSAAAAAVLGVAGSVLATLPPALEATRVTPSIAMTRRRVERTALRWLPRLAGAGGASLVLTALLARGSDALGGGFAALATFFVGCCLLVPWCVASATRGLQTLLRRAPALVRHMLAGVAAGISRTGVAAAALSFAVAATVGIALMIGSFRAAVEDWLASVLLADIHVAPADGGRARVETAIDPRVPAALIALPAVRELSVHRFVRIPTGAEETTLAATQLPEEGYAGIRLLGDGGEARRAFDHDDAVFVSEPYASRRRLRVGEELRLPTARGERSFRVAGVYRDYASERGVVMMRLSLYRECWDDPDVSSLGVYLEPGHDAAEVLPELRAAVAGLQELQLRSSRDVREASLAVFDRTFAVTRVVRWLTVIVALVGMLTALGAWQVERRRELALLRSMGMTRGQLAALVLGQTGLVGFIAGALAVPSGVGLAWLLVHVINRRAFGWSMDLVVIGAPLADALWIATSGALLAGLLPAWLAARGAPAPALRGE